jgi:hypothetical protein
LPQPTSSCERLHWTSQLLQSVLHCRQLHHFFVKGQMKQVWWLQQMLLWTLMLLL